MFQNDFDKNLLPKSNFGKISLLKLTSAKFSVEVELRQNLLPKLDFGKKCNFGTTYIYREREREKIETNPSNHTDIDYIPA